MAPSGASLRRGCHSQRDNRDYLQHAGEENSSIVDAAAAAAEATNDASLRQPRKAAFEHDP